VQLLRISRYLTYNIAPDAVPEMGAALFLRPTSVWCGRFRILMQYSSCLFLFELEPQDICVGLSVATLVLVDRHGHAVAGRIAGKGVQRLPLHPDFSSDLRDRQPVADHR
jgi:hypothetical protein